MIQDVIKKELLRIVRRIGYRARSCRTVPYGRMRYKTSRASTDLRLFVQPWAQIARFTQKPDGLLIETYPEPTQTWMGVKAVYGTSKTLPYDDPHFFEKVTKICAEIFNKHNRGGGF